MQVNILNTYDHTLPILCCFVIACCKSRCVVQPYRSGHCELGLIFCCSYKDYSVRAATFLCTQAHATRFVDALYLWPKGGLCRFGNVCCRTSTRRIYTRMTVDDGSYRSFLSLLSSFLSYFSSYCIWRRSTENCCMLTSLLLMLRFSFLEIFICMYRKHTHTLLRLLPKKIICTILWRWSSLVTKRKKKNPHFQL